MNIFFQLNGLFLHYAFMFFSLGYLVVQKDPINQNLYNLIYMEFIRQR